MQRFPRFDFAAASWRELLDAEPRGYILVNANFPLVNSRFSDDPRVEGDAMVRAGWDPVYVDRLVQELTLVFANYLEAIRKLAAARPDQAILVRPHPFERPEAYRSVLAGYSNVLIDGSGSVLDRIKNATAVIHLNCGTAIESVMLGKLPIQLEYLNTPATAAHATLPGRVSRGVASFDTLLSVVDNIDAETAAFDFASVHAAYIEAFFHHNDGHAAERVAEVLINENPRRGYVSLASTLNGARSNPSLGQIAKGAASLVLGSAVTENLRLRTNPARRDKRLAPAVVADLLERIALHHRSAPSGFVAARARCTITGLPLASIAIEKRPTGP